MPEGLRGLTCCFHVINKDPVANWHARNEGLASGRHAGVEASAALINKVSRDLFRRESWRVGHAQVLHCRLLGVLDEIRPCGRMFDVLRLGSIYHERWLSHLEFCLRSKGFYTGRRHYKT